ncbi:MAG: 3-hydroxyisobutyrate dehydrogenase [Bauldia sp.]|nr:3-hydroxyisobutyrate dehydrogenase [Bauldia sp.]
MRVALIGVGNMGKPMGRNMLNAGHEVTGFDLSSEAVDYLVQHGGKAASSAVEAAKGAEVVMTMLPTSEHVRDVYLGEAALLDNVAPGTVFMDSSTISISVTRDLAVEVKKRGGKMLDTPVSGGTHGAEAGTLTFMVGGDAEDLELVRPLLEAMGRNIVHAGTNGAGQTAKICNNMLSGICMIGCVEALALGVANGLDPKILSDIMRTSSGTNFALQQLNPYPGVMDTVPSSRGYTGGFRTEFQLKDMRLAVELASESRTLATLGEIACNLYALHCDAGYAKHDYSSIMLMMAKELKEQMPKGD